MKRESDTLDEMIMVLEKKQARQLQLLKEDLLVTYENLQPLNMIKNAFTSVQSSPDLKSTLINNIIGIGTGFISKKLLIGATHNPVKKLFGTLLEFAVASFVSKHPDGIKAAGKNILQRILQHRQDATKEVLSIQPEPPENIWVIK